jgi:hypothetical protein
MNTPESFSLEQIDGSLKQISSGFLGIWGINSKDEILYRTGISPKNNQGENWHKTEGSLKHISSGEYGVWGVNLSDLIYYRAGITDLIPYGTNWIQI